MTARVSWDDVKIGEELPERMFRFRRIDLIKYAGASGDFNPIHWNERTALQVGLPGVVAHGMLTMAQVARLVTDWVGDPGAMVDYGVRFSKPLVVPDSDDGVDLAVRGRIADKLDGRQVRIDLTATYETSRILTAARALVRLA